MKMLLALGLGLLLSGPLHAAAGSLELFDAGEFAAAEAAARRELDADPGGLKPLIILGRTQLTLDRAAEAVQTLDRATRAHPRSAEAWYRLGQAVTVRVAESGTWRRMFMAGDIGEAFARAVELAPDNAEYRWAWFEFCRQAPGMVGGGRKRALAQAKALAEIDPARGLRARAALLLQDGDAVQAEELLRKAIATSPDVADHRYGLGYFYVQQERWDEAFATFEEIATRFPAEAQALFQIGKTAAISGQRLDAGERALRRYLRHKPKAGEPPLAWAHFRLGQVHEQRRDRRAAADAYETALKLDPKLSDARQALRALAAR